ncbi:MAG TPA: DNA-binding protein, partial [Clostridium sp.]|nr:DNA-binding protein [Clostridium sp.]
MKIQESAENYLETILMLKKRNGYVRSIDIAEELDFSKPSVSVAMKNLRENGYIGIDENGHITL